MTPVRSQIEGIEKLFLYYKNLGESAMAQVEETDLIKEPTEGINSIAIIVKHLAGNMRSRWTDFKTTDGEKEWRNRDLEFEEPMISRTEIMQVWENGWNVLLTALKETIDAELENMIYIRNEGHSIQDAFQRQLAHYAYHVGQIVYLAKIYKGDHWKSLSIPKHHSKDYNQIKFSEERQQRHFTDKV
ncbi:MAG: DUF1572 family protein [Saprospiraceae bacterium]|nr:DUF1572 family protein [Saprospiraceae bacterium]